MINNITDKLIILPTYYMKILLYDSITILQYYFEIMLLKS